MKFPNYLKNVFAGLGILSLIFYTCASESTSDTTNVNPPQLTGGTYQITSFVNLAGYPYIVALNTETGVIKTYALRSNLNNDNWWDVSDDNTPAGFDGSLTLTH